jgi:hypothetical protein
MKARDADNVARAAFEMHRRNKDSAETVLVEPG